MKQLIEFTISVRERVWGFFFEFKGTSGGPCRELNIEFESPSVNAACALLLLLVKEVEAVAEAAAEAVADADAAQCSEAGEESEGFTCSNSHTKGQTQMGGAARAHHRPLPSLAPCLCLFLL